MADITISKQDALIKELIRNYTVLEDKLQLKDVQMGQLTAHLLFLGLDQKCS